MVQFRFFKRREMKNKGLKKLKAPWSNKGENRFGADCFELSFLLRKKFSE